MIPFVVDWSGMVIAMSMGGALIPGMTSFYLLISQILPVGRASRPQSMLTP